MDGDHTSGNGADAVSHREFRARMEAQCEQIRRYRQLVARESGRQLTEDEAAAEWIDHYARSFARETESTGKN